MFQSRKRKILSDLAQEGPDSSPKGSVDTEILPLINLLNAQEGVVTTSSCAGRIAVFLEGVKKGHQIAMPVFPKGRNIDNSHSADSTLSNKSNSGYPLAAFGGKGYDGRWIFVSHQPVSTDGLSWATLGIEKSQEINSEHCIDEETRFLHFKFEPMILHVMTSTLDLANRILKAALSSGFRESGIMNPIAPPTLAIRATGLAIDCIVGYMLSSDNKIYQIVDEAYLKTFLKLSNLRFRENERRREGLFKELQGIFGQGSELKRSNWEDKAARQYRLKKEGLEWKAALENSKEVESRKLKRNGAEEHDDDDAIGLHEMFKPTI